RSCWFSSISAAGSRPRRTAGVSPAASLPVTAAHSSALRTIGRSQPPDRRGLPTLRLLLHRVIVAGERRLLHVASGAAFDVELAARIDHLALAQRVRRTSLDRHALENVEVDVLVMRLRRNCLRR